MNTGQPVQYADFIGRIVEPPTGSKPDPSKVWIQTPDLMLVAVPNSDKLKVLGQLPAINFSDDEKDLMTSAGIPLPPEPKQEAKYFPKTGYVKVPESKRVTAGLYKALAGGLGADKESLVRVISGLNSKTPNKPYRVVSAEDSSWHVVIEITS